MNRLFITGTDTGIGKTYVACELTRYLVSRGRSVGVMKPVASGSENTPDGLRNEDALALMDAMNVDMSYPQVNPYVFEPAIAPHIAADRAGVVVDLSVISEIADSVRADTLVIEGAGGWCVPLNETQLMAELVRKLKSRVILVVGMKLGCINHALLSARQIIQDGCELAGWIANGIDPEMPEYRNNLITLSKLMPVPLISEISWQGKISKNDLNVENILINSEISY